MEAESKNEPAGAWVRVSTGGQDEANQVPDIQKHCTDRGYGIAKRYELNDKSASKGEQQAKLDEMLEDMREGTIKVLVCWHSDRVERRGPEALFRLLREIKDAKGRIESVKEPLLGTADLSGEAVTALNAVIAHQYSVHLGEQVRTAQGRIRANNGFVAGGIPWGYVIVGEKYAKTLVPTDLCREIVPKIFQRCIYGDSCRTIAMWLDSEGVPTMRGGKWSEGSVHRILTNMTYAGRRQDEGTKKANGKPSRKNRNTIMTCEAVITMDMWNRAQDALRNRPQRGPGMAITNPNRPMLASLKCARCARKKGIDSPMYRIKTGRRGQNQYYYRCAGRQPQRKGCGNMVRYDESEKLIVIWHILGQTMPHKTRQWVEGKNWDAELAEVNQDIRELAQNPLAERWAERMAELGAKVAELTELNKTREHGHYEEVIAHNPDGSVMAESEYFRGLDNEGRRKYLASRDIRVEKSTTDDGSKGIRLVIDGTDYGVWPYPPM
jgi:DNA invertase Pin-like site-specific DNA recombinase